MREGCVCGVGGGAILTQHKVTGGVHHSGRSGHC